MTYIFLSFLMLWRHRSRDQNGPKFNIRFQSLLESFSKNIFKLSCWFLNIDFKNGHDYFFLKKFGSKKYQWKVCWLSAQRLFELAIKENFAKGLSVCYLWKRCQFFLILFAFAENWCNVFGCMERAWVENTHVILGVILGDAYTLR